MNSCQGVCGGRAGANHKPSPTTEAKAPAPGVELEALQMNPCHGLFGGGAGANHKSCPTKEAKAQA